MNKKILIFSIFIYEIIFYVDWYKILKLDKKNCPTSSIESN